MILILSVNNKKNYDKHYHVDRVTPYLTIPANGKELLLLIYGSLSKDRVQLHPLNYNKTYMNHPDKEARIIK